MLNYDDLKAVAKLTGSQNYQDVMQASVVGRMARHPPPSPSNPPPLPCPATDTPTSAALKLRWLCGCHCPQRVRLALEHASASTSDMAADEEQRTTHLEDDPTYK
jgi:hypothetical protein